LYSTLSTKTLIYYPVLTLRHSFLDPGCYEDFEKKELTDFIKTNKLKPIAIINTHCHIDHVLGNDYL